jgi:hypothetical protein
LEGLAMENVGIFYVHLVYFTAIGKMLWSFGIFWGHLVYFSPFWHVVPRRIWQPCNALVNQKGIKAFQCIHMYVRAAIYIRPGHDVHYFLKFIKRFPLFSPTFTTH